jgi:hypothetical protein
MKSLASIEGAPASVMDSWVRPSAEVISQVLAVCWVKVAPCAAVP